MEVLKWNLSELEIGSTVESFQKFLDSQRSLFHSQIDQLQSIVINHCKLTDVNPLAHEMAAGALSVKIGKRPRDLLNPKAVNYMQSVFSIKDTINKKESREISALFGVTVTQVREFFASQRSRVKKQIRLSREKSNKPKPSKELQGSSKELQDGVSTSSHSIILMDPVPLNVVVSNGIDAVPLNIVFPTSVEEVPSMSTMDEGPGVDGLDKHFVENIFSLMRKEETFSGQVELMELILQIQNPSVLCWFISNGGVMILATWLSELALEEQTSILFVILKDTRSDISNRAKALLSRWSKILERSQAMKRPNGMKNSSDVQKEMMLKQSISEIMSDEAWQTTIDASGENHVFSFGSSGNFRKSEPLQAPKLLTASAGDSSRKHIRGVSSSQTRERRKVQLVEHPGQKTSGRSIPVARPVSAIRARPMSTDDIQKAKMRAQFMQSKYGNKPTSSSNENNNEAKTESPIKHLTNHAQAGVLFPATKVVPPKIDEHKEPETLVPALDVYVQPKVEEHKEHAASLLVPKVEENGPVLPASNVYVEPKVEEHMESPTLLPVPNVYVCPKFAEHNELAPLPPAPKVYVRRVEEHKERATPVYIQLKIEEHQEAATPVYVQPKIEEHKEPATPLPALKVYVRTKVDEPRAVLASKIPNCLEATQPKPSSDSKESLLVKCKRVQIPWQTPPEMRMNSEWNIGAGAESKEVEIQRNRLCREKEIVYRSAKEIPPNPKEPWDNEMDYDDTLTPEISTQQQPDPADQEETSIRDPEYENRAQVYSSAVTSQVGGSGSSTEPDLELLAVLLQNPELVFALTSGQAGNLSSEETVRLLDMIKIHGAALMGNSNGLGGEVSLPERVEISLPSPTPPTDPGTSGWRPEAAKNPFSRQNPASQQYVQTSIVLQDGRSAPINPILPSPTPERSVPMTNLHPIPNQPPVMVKHAPILNPTQLQPQPSFGAPTYNRYLGHGSGSWSTGQGAHFQAHPNYNGGYGQPLPVVTGGNEFGRSEEIEMWSSNEYMSGHNFLESRTNLNRNYRPQNLNHGRYENGGGWRGRDHNYRGRRR